MNLTPSQKEALIYNKNILVEAGAGSGKTTLFVERYLKILIENPSISPQNIIALTFTKKAASECQFRIYNKIINAVKKNIVPSSLIDEVEKAPITTIHSFCSNLIKMNALQLNISPFFSVLTEVESLYLYKKACSQLIKELSNKDSSELKTYIESNSEKKLHLDLLQCYKKQEKIKNFTQDTCHNMTATSKALWKIYLDSLKEYELLKKMNTCLDYSDLINLCLKLLQSPQIQVNLQHQIHYIMLDECQDIDPLQWDIITKLCHSKKILSSKKLFLVGDPKQCIYRFRGANLSFFSDLNKRFTKEKTTCNVVYLQENFRTNKKIIEIINPLFSCLFNEQNSIQYTPLKPTLTKPATLKLGFLKNTTNLEDEYEYIHSILKKYLISSEKKEIVILARQRRHCEKIFRYLKEKNIPVQTDKQKGFFSQQLIIDCFLLIKVLIFPTDFLSWSSLLQSPLFNFSQDLCQTILLRKKDTIIEKLLEIANKHPNEVFLINEIKKIKNWFKLTKIYPLHRVLLLISEEKEFQNYIKNITNGEYQLEIFLSILQTLENSMNYSEKELLDILEFKLSMHDASFDIPQTAQTRVNIMTIHAAKGLEFDHVILANCHNPFQLHASESCLIDDDFFHCNTNSDADKEIRKTYFLKEKNELIEEEKRLFYVACTRAKESLLLTGIYEKKKESSAFSYLSFITSLPKFYEESNYIGFVYDGDEYKIDCEFQVLKNDSLPTKSKEKLDIASASKNKLQNTQEPIQLLSTSDLIVNPDDSFLLTLNNLQGQSAGTILHECISYIITASPNVELLKEFCFSHNLFFMLSKKDQDNLEKQLYKLNISSTLNSYKDYDFSFEESLVLAKNSVEINARFDAISISENHATLLEIKTDKQQSTETLLKKYKKQLDIYSYCLYKYYNLESVTIILYSSYLDKDISQTHTSSYLKELEYAIEKSLKDRQL